MCFKYPRWARLRAEVFRQDDFTCRHCGWQPAEVPNPYDGRYTVITWFGNTFRSLELDHIVPVCLGGDDSRANLQTLCNTCNGRKGIRAEANCA